MWVEDIIEDACDELAGQLQLPWEQVDPGMEHAAHVMTAAAIAIHLDQVADFRDDVTGGNDCSR